MAVKIRGLEKHQQDAPETPSDDAVPSKDREQLRELRDAQLEGERFIAESLLRRVGKGATAWEEHDWEWADPDWETDPDTWKGLPRLALLLVRLDQSFANLGWLTSFSEKPLWCEQCSDPEKRPAGFVVGRCKEHLPEAALVKRLADSMGWRSD